MAFRKTDHFGTYVILSVINDKVSNLVCNGQHDDAGLAFKELADYVRTELRAAGIRLAEQNAQSKRNARIVRREQREAPQQDR